LHIAKISFYSNQTTTLNVYWMYLKVISKIHTIDKTDKKRTDSGIVKEDIHVLSKPNYGKLL
ncbi:MAG: hypothetical protein R3321_11510, partial [Nitrososphaeraceae archaeon]|nr:hypothetical protein [Nitrososphaeraceae archaeon]